MVDLGVHGGGVIHGIAHFCQEGYPPNLEASEQALFPRVQNVWPAFVNAAVRSRSHFIITVSNVSDEE